MSDLYELLAPYFDVPESPSSHIPPPSSSDPQTTTYLNRLSTLSLNDLASTEPASLLHAAQSHLRNLQALSKRSHKAVIASSSHLSNLTSLLPALGTQTSDLSNQLPQLERAATDFAQKYDRSTENAVLDRRKRAMLLSRNVDRVSDVMELPTLLSSTVTAAQAPIQASTGSSSTSYASALDLHAHIKRLNALYPHSELVGHISKEAEAEMQNLTSILIASLQSQNLKLAAAMRTIGWLRRVAPDLAEDGYAAPVAPTRSAKSLGLSASNPNAEGALGSLFLICRLQSLHKTFEALEPLRELAEQDTAQREQTKSGSKPKQQAQQQSALGSQSERYLKRYLEIFREQSFAIISMYKSIFPSGLPSAESADSSTSTDDGLLPLPSPLSSFTLALVDMLQSTLRDFLPNVTDKSSRESLLTQVLYCASSLGRLGADFGMTIALLEEELASDDEESASGSAEEDAEWVSVMKKHRIQASRLEVLARGVGSGRKASADVKSPSSEVAAG